MFRSVSSSGVLSGQGVVQTLTTTGLIQVEAGQVLSVLLQVCGYQEESRGIMIIQKPTANASS